MSAEKESKRGSSGEKLFKPEARKYTVALLHFGSEVRTFPLSEKAQKNSDLSAVARSIYLDFQTKDLENKQSLLTHSTPRELWKIQFSERPLQDEGNDTLSPTYCINCERIWGGKLITRLGLTATITRSFVQHLIDINGKYVVTKKTPYFWKKYKSSDVFLDIEV